MVVWLLWAGRIVYSPDFMGRLILKVSVCFWAAVELSCLARLEPSF